MPRPTKLTPQIADLIVGLIERGTPRDDAARIAGIHPSTLYDWLARGRHTPVNPDDHTKHELLDIARRRHIPHSKSWTKARIADAINNHTDPFSEFADRVYAADSRFIAAALAHMQRVGSDDWRMWDRLLERRFPDRFAVGRAGVDEASDVTVEVRLSWPDTAAQVDDVRQLPPGDHDHDHDDGDGDAG